MKVREQVAYSVPAVVDVVHAYGTGREPHPLRCPLVRPWKAGSPALSTTLDGLEEPVRHIVHKNDFSILAARHPIKRVLHVTKAAAQEIRDPRHIQIERRQRKREGRIPHLSVVSQLPEQ